MRYLNWQALSALLHVQRALCVSAEQRPELAERQTGPFPFCSDPAVVNFRNVILGRDRLEPSYCYSLLNVPTTTSTMFQTSLTTIMPVITTSTTPPAAVVTVFTTTTTSSTTVTTSKTTVTTTTTTTNDSAPVKMRRQPNTIKKDPGNKKPCSFASNNDVKSRACSCILGVSPTVTVLQTATTSSTVTIYSTLILTAILPDATKLRTTTTTSLETETSTSTLTVTVTSTTSPPPSLKTCGFGTAFGYQNPVGGVQKSFTLNTQSGSGCNRWGWYETPTLAELQSGISGPLYVGAGGNDVTQAIDVGIWVATANAQGRVTVTYLLNPPYALAAVHIQLVCLPITNCNQDRYTYNAGAIPNLPTWSNPTPLAYPTCTGGSRVSLIVSAISNILTVTAACPPPKAV